jgi:hypothetical protein
VAKDRRRKTDLLNATVFFSPLLRAQNQRQPRSEYPEKTAEILVSTGSGGGEIRKRIRGIPLDSLCQVFTMEKT